MTMQIFKIHENDNVAVAIETIPAGACVEVDGEKIIANMEIPAGHKMALREIKEGEQVVKYGCPIGNAKEDIRQGDWIHVHNVKTGLGDLLTYTYEPTGAKQPLGKARAAAFISSADLIFFAAHTRSLAYAASSSSMVIIPPRDGC